jgi:hypothetical protein
LEARKDDAPGTSEISATRFHSTSAKMIPQMAAVGMSTVGARSPKTVTAMVAVVAVSVETLKVGRHAARACVCCLFASRLRCATAHSARL